MSAPAIGSLCSGYGGLDEAAAQLTGGKVSWVSDIDKGACKILAHRYPDVPNLGDFTKTKWVPDCPTELGGCGRPAEVLQDLSGWQCNRCQMLWPISLGKVYWPEIPEPIYMLTAGYPCQPFSHAGKREGTNDDRHLWPEVLRCLTELRPPFALFENVRGHLSLGFDQVLADLATHDYDARWIVLRAADIGAPHGRARLFILAADARRGGDRWDLVGAGRGAVRVGPVRGEDPTAGGAAGRDGVLGSLTLLPTPTSSDTNGPGSHGDGGTDLRTTVSLLPTPTARDGKDGKDGQIRREPHRPDDVDTLSRALTILLPAPLASSAGGVQGVDRAVALLPTPSAADGLGGHERRGGARGDELLLNGVAKEMASRLLPTPLVESTSEASHGQISGQWRDQMAEALTRWGDYAPAIRRWEQILGQPAPAPTMLSTKGNPQLSPRFVEWMMGLPDGWVCDVPDMTRNEKLKALGNGVVTQQAVEGVRRLLALDGAA